MTEDEELWLWLTADLDEIIDMAGETDTDMQKYVCKKGERKTDEKET